MYLHVLAAALSMSDRDQCNRGEMLPMIKEKQRHASTIHLRLSLMHSQTPGLELCQGGGKRYIREVQTQQRRTKRETNERTKQQLPKQAKDGAHSTQGNDLKSHRPPKHLYRAACETCRCPTTANSLSGKLNVCSLPHASSRGARIGDPAVDKSIKR